MKRVGIVLLFFLISIFEAFCSYSGVGWTYGQIVENKGSMTVGITQRLQANGCGSYGTSEWLVEILNAIGEKDICDQHDIDYATLGMSKYEADVRFYNRMRNRIYEKYDIILSILQNSTDSEALKLAYTLVVRSAEVADSGRILLAEIIARIYKEVVVLFGDDAYAKAQALARSYKQRTGNSYYTDKYTSDDYDE